MPKKHWALELWPLRKLSDIPNLRLGDFANGPAVRMPCVDLKQAETSALNAISHDPSLQLGIVSVHQDGTITYAVLQRLAASGKTLDDGVVFVTQNGVRYVKKADVGL